VPIIFVNILLGLTQTGYQDYQHYPPKDPNKVMLVPKNTRVIVGERSAPR
jgi:hypothetical protein